MPKFLLPEAESNEVSKDGDSKQNVNAPISLELKNLIAIGSRVWRTAIDCKIKQVDRYNAIILTMTDGPFATLQSLVVLDQDRFETRPTTR